MDTTVLLINYNGEEDTVQCICSLNKYIEYINIFIVDNKSSDDNILLLKKSLKKEYDTVSEGIYSKYPLTIYKSGLNYIYLLESNINRGFGGGCNIGIKYIIENQLSTYIWMLNNDTYIKKDSLTPLINKFNSDENIAIVGSTLIYAFDEQTIQCSGGAKYYSLIGKSKLINNRKKINNLKEYKGQIDFICGASMLSSVNTIKMLGLFDEDYFMYSEEQDWQIRAQKTGKKITYANNSIIYHKEAASSKKNTALYFFYINRSAMILSLKHYPYFSFFVFLFLFLQSALKIFSNNFIYSIKGLISGVSYYFK
ncbi:MAG: glycosyltransferase family 2 protein [Bacteroidales bacterium]|jgi:GT2 family glycosyltransferase|nr:glycosyltransferase family 2 protein [Bacteroidales bacterium]